MFFTGSLIQSNCTVR